MINTHSINHKDSIFTQAIDASYNLNKYESNDYSDDELNNKELNKILDSLDIDENFNDNSTYDCEINRYSSAIELKSKNKENRKISNYFTSTWSENLKTLKKKKIYSLPFYSAQIKPMTTKKLTDYFTIPHLSLDS